MDIESIYLGKNFFRVTKTVLLLFIFGFYARGAEIYSCEDLFNPKSLHQIAFNLSNTQYKNFDPIEAQSLIGYITGPEIQTEIKRIDKEKDNLLFYQDHVTAAQETLKNLKDNVIKIRTKNVRAKAELLTEIQNELNEINIRKSEKKMNYYWIWLISLKVSATKELADFFDVDQKTETTRRKEMLVALRRFGSRLYQSDFFALKNFANASGVRPFSYQYKFFEKNAVILPVFSRLDYNDFLKLENSGIDLAATPLELPINHGTYRYAYSDSTNHDLYHVLMMVVDRQTAGANWPLLHEKIYANIQKLSGNDLRYTAYVYYYLLHEVFKRGRIVKYLEGSPFVTIIDGELASQMLGAVEDDKNDGQGFRDVADKKEIIQIGIENLMRILNSMRTKI